MSALRLPQFQRLASPRVRSQSSTLASTSLNQLAGPSRLRHFSSTPIVEKIKMKSRKAVTKRFNLLGGGLWKRMQSNKSHGLTKESSSYIRGLSGGILLQKQWQKQLMGRMHPYAK